MAFNPNTPHKLHVIRCKFITLKNVKHFNFDTNKIILRWIYFQQRDLNNAFTPEKMPIKELADYTFFIKEATWLAGHIDISFYEKKQNDVCKNSFYFTEGITHLRSSSQISGTDKMVILFQDYKFQWIFKSTKV